MYVAELDNEGFVHKETNPCEVTSVYQTIQNTLASILEQQKVTNELLKAIVAKHTTKKEKSANE